MAEYIEREAALDCFACDLGKKDYSVSYQGFMTESAFRINVIPAADVVPVRHGQWIDKPGGTYQRMQSWCSVCGKRSGIGGIESNRHKPYCPNCGARMDLVTDCNQVKDGDGDV